VADLSPVRRRPAPIAFWTGIAVFAVYLSNFRVITEGDSLPARYLPFAMWGARNLTLDAVASVASRHPKNPPYWIWQSPQGHRLSIYPIVTPLLTAPFYAPAIVYLNHRGWTDDRLERVATWMEKLSAAAISAVSAALLFLLLRRQLPQRQAWILTFGYALGTSAWPINSQALWQHGTAHLLLVLGLLAVTASPQPRPVGAGVAAGLLIANRPPDAFFAAALLAFLLFRLRRRALPGLLAAAAILVPFLYYNIHFFHSVWGGYGIVGFGGPHPFYKHPLLPGVAGLLVSPAKGLFVFSPFLLFLSAARNTNPHAEERALALCLTAAIVAQLLFYARTDWRGGACYGPRFLSDALPALLWLLAFSVKGLGKRAWECLAALILVSVAIQAVGAFCYPGGGSDERFFPPTLSRLVIAPAVWSWRNAPFLVEARAGLAAPELLYAARDFLRHALAGAI
jgi:hypothetical protein